MLIICPRFCDRNLNPLDIKQGNIQAHKKRQEDSAGTSIPRFTGWGVDIYGRLAA